MAATHSVIEYADKHQLLGCNDVVESEHCSYVISVALDDYFNGKIGKWDDVNEVAMNPARRSHREKFIEELKH